MTSAAAERLGSNLERFGRVQVRLPEVLAAWATAAPEVAVDSARFALLAAALDELALAERIVLPSKQSWDRTVHPPLPRLVRVNASRKAATVKAWRDHPWSAELDWVASLPAVSDALLTDLIAVNRWLAVHSAERPPSAPVRVRSREILGDEKRLDVLARSRVLFAPGRLSFELLACRRLPPPIATARVGSGGVWLVVENSDSYWLARDAAAHTGVVDVVAWGAGAAAPQALLSLPERGDPVERIFYWGDIDPKGVAIAVASAAACRSAGLPRLEPAIGLWSATAKCKGSSEGTIDWTDTDLGWLEEAEASVASVAERRARIAQEALGLPAIVEAITAEA